jgi:archaellum component FlaC
MNEDSHQDDDLVYRLRERARIRRQIPTRKSVQEGQPDRIADLLEEAAERIEVLEVDIGVYATRYAIQSREVAPIFDQNDKLRSLVHQLERQIDDQKDYAIEFCINMLTDLKEKGEAFK